MNLICIKTCFWGTLITEGQVITVDSESEIPPSVRPFFDVQEKVEAEKIIVKENKINEITELRNELEKLGKPFDLRWSKATLEGKLQVARRDAKAKAD